MSTTTTSGDRQTLSLITDVQLRKWGKELVIEGLNDPLNRGQIQLVFKNCHEIRWSLLTDEAEPDTEADVIGLSLSKAEDGEFAILTTDLFELSVLYQSLEVRQPAPAARTVTTPVAD